MEIRRLSSGWATAGVLLIGCLAPVITYCVDFRLRFRVGLWMLSTPSFQGAIAVLMAQSRDQPVSLVGLVGIPLAAIAFVVIAWVRRRARSRADHRPGIGGWLAVFVWTTVLGVAFDTHGLYHSRHAIWVNLRALPHLDRTVAPALVLLILARHLVIAVAASARLAGLWLIIRRSARAPAYWTIVCAILVPVHVYEAAIMAWEQRVAASVNLTVFPTTDFATFLIAGAIVVFGWGLYWMRSQRVLATFGRRGLDLFVERASASELAPAPVADTPPR